MARINNVIVVEGRGIFALEDIPINGKIYITPNDLKILFREEVERVYDKVY